MQYILKREREIEREREREKRNEKNMTEIERKDKI